jgi:hypothetical protein
MKRPLFPRFTDALSDTRASEGNCNSSNINYMGGRDSTIVEDVPLPYQLHVSKREGK